MHHISCDELKARLDRGDQITLVMALRQHAYRAKHIPGSLQFDNWDDALKQLDPSAEIIVYCSDEACAASARMGHFLESHGYTHVVHFVGGLFEWEEAGYPLDGDLRDTLTSPVA